MVAKQAAASSQGAGQGLSYAFVAFTAAIESGVAVDVINTNAAKIIADSNVTTTAAASIVAATASDTAAADRKSVV